MKKNKNKKKDLWFWPCQKCDCADYCQNSGCQAERNKGKTIK